MLGVLQGDVAEFGSCPGRYFSLFLHYPSIALYVLSAVFLVYLLGWSSAEGAVANLISGGAVACFLAARTLCGAFHFLWGERGRVTFGRVKKCIRYRAPNGSKSVGAIHMLLADTVLLPLCTAVSSFQKSDALACVAAAFYPSDVNHPLIYYCVWLCDIVLIVVSWNVLLPREEVRMVPLGKVKSLLCHAAFALCAWLLVPTLAFLSSALPCDGKRMRFLFHEGCLSSRHRRYIAQGYWALVLHSLALDGVIGSLSGLRDWCANLQLCDEFLLQLVMAHRLIYVFGSAFASGIFWCGFCALLSASLLFKVKRSFFSSCSVLQFLTESSLQLCALSSLCCMIEPLSPYAVFIWAGVLSVGWVVLFAVFVRRYGLTLCENEQEMIFDM